MSELPQAPAAAPPAPVFAGGAEGGETLALEEFERALVQGTELLSKGDAREAAVVLERALKFHPRHQRGRNLLGLSLFKLGDLAKSEVIYRGLIEDHPDDPTLRVNLGLVLLKAGAPSDAVRCFETALELSPTHAKAQNYLGLALSSLGELARAKECFLRCGNAQMAEKMAQALSRSAASLQPAEMPAQAQPSLPPPPPADAAVEAPPVVLGAIQKTHAWVATPPKGITRATPAEGVAAVPPPLLTSIPQPPPLPVEAQAEADRATATAAAAATPTAQAAPAAAQGAGSPAEALSRGQRLAASLDALASARQQTRVAAPPPPEANPKLPVDAPGSPQRLRDARPSRPLELGARESAEPKPPPAVVAAPAAAAPAAAEPVPAPSPPRPPPSALSDYTHRQRLSVPSAEGGFAIGPTELVIHVDGEMLTRLDGMVASWGTLSIKPELKRFRGKATDKPFGEGARRMLRTAGRGRFVVAREGRRFTELELGDEPAYFREETLFAFEETLMFENGRVPSRASDDLHLVHLRGHGRLLLCTVGQPRSAEVVKGEPLRIPMDQLVGWHGPNIQPRLVPICEEAPELGVALELSGEGRALVDAPDEPR